MVELKDLLQSADWKKEKHVPVIEAPKKVAKGKPFKVTVAVGKEIAHPNKTEHHISFVTLFFHPEGEKFPYLIGRTDFSAHGASTEGPDTSGVYTSPEVVISFKTDKSGTLLATSYCNIHGLWQGSKAIAVE